MRLTCGGGDTPRARCGPNSSIFCTCSARERTRLGPPRGETSARAWLRRLCRHFCKCGRGVGRSLFMVDGGRCLLGVPDVVASRLLVAAKRRERTGALPEAADGGSFTALATQHHALATVKVDNSPTAQRLTSGSVPSQQDLYAGPAPGTGHSLLAKEQRRYLVNVQTCCAHPTNDGVTMICGHKRLKVCTWTSSIAGFELCAFARGRPQE